MRWMIASTVALAVGLSGPEARPCGVKLTAKAPLPKRSVQRSSNPSSVLLVGDPPHRLTRELEAAGHNVQKADNAESANGNPTIVLADGDQAEAARTKFPNATVIARTGNVKSDVSAVEARVARTPVGGGDRVAVAGSGTRRPIATGPREARVPVGAKQADDSEIPARPAPEPKAEPKAEAPRPEPKPEPKAEEPKPEPVKVAAVSKPVRAEPEPRPEPRSEPVARPAKLGKSAKELYFRLGSPEPTSDRAVANLAKWMKSHGDTRVRIEGHTDTSGPSEFNQDLGQRRADAVKEALVSAGVESSRLETVSFGETKPKYENGRDRRNRRVAIVVE